VVEEWVVAEEWVVEEWVAGGVTQVERPGAGRAAVGETMAIRGHLGVCLTLLPGVAVEIREQGDSVVRGEVPVVEEWVVVGETMASRGHLGVGLTLVPGVAVEILGVISGLTAGEVLINI
jgi:hypothetical protein